MMKKSASSEKLADFGRSWSSMIDNDEHGYDQVFDFIGNYDFKKDPADIANFVVEETLKSMTRFDQDHLDQRISHLSNNLFDTGGWFDLKENKETTFLDLSPAHQDGVHAIKDGCVGNVRIISAVFDLLHHREASAYAFEHDATHNFPYNVSPYVFGHDAESNIANDYREQSLMFILNNIEDSQQFAKKHGKPADGRLAHALMFLAVQSVNVPVPHQASDDQYEGVYAGRLVGTFLNRLEPEATVVAVESVATEFRTFLEKSKVPGLTVMDGETWLQNIARGISLSVKEPMLRDRLIEALGVGRLTPVSEKMNDQTSMPTFDQMEEIKARRDRWIAIPEAQRPPLGNPPVSWNDTGVLHKIPKLGQMAQAIDNRASSTTSTPEVLTEHAVTPKKTLSV